jgi:hypothetical protein
MNNATESIERLLQQAAAFESERACPADIVDRALAGIRPRRGHAAIWTTALATACVATWLLLQQGTIPLPVRQIAPVQTAHVKPGTNRVALQQSYQQGNQLKERAGTDGANNRSILPHKPTSQKPKVARQAPRATGRSHHSEHRKQAGRRMLASLPKAIWREERVQNYQAGMLAPAWLVRQDEDNQIHLQPAIIQVPLAGGQAIARVAPASLEEERQ